MTQEPAVWYVSADGKMQHGPHTLGQARAMVASGALGPGSLAWREGMAEWKKVGEIEELAVAASAEHPPPVPASAGPVRATAATGEYVPAEPKKKGRNVVVVLLIVGGLVVLGLPAVSLLVGIMLPALGKARSSARQLKDSTQIRGIHQGMVLWGQNNSDMYPMPSVIDVQNATLAAGTAKDLPRHMVSVLIYNGFFSPELCVSKAEVNPKLAVAPGYEYVTPAGAVQPRMALWDPSFKALPEDDDAGTPGGMSYGMMPPFGGRKSRWSTTFQAAEAIVGNRGPAYDAGTRAGTWVLHADGGGSNGGNAEVGVSSNTLLIHGGRSTWEGNICYNDNHVNYETSPVPESAPFRFGGDGSGRGRPGPDNLFVNEDDGTGVKVGTNDLVGAGLKNQNNLLRLWTNGTVDPATGGLADIPGYFWFD